MAVRTKPAAAIAPASQRMTLVTLHQTDPDGQYVLEQSLWNVKDRRAHAILSKCEQQGDKEWPRALLDEFIALRKECEMPNESYDNKLLGKHYQITLSYANDVIIEESSQSSDEEESERIAESAASSDEEADADESEEDA